MNKIGLKQLTERFIRVNKIMARIERNHSFGTYKRLANLSKQIGELPDEIKKSYFSVGERYNSMVSRLDEHKEKSILGIAKRIDVLLDNISDRVFDGEDYKDLKNDLDLILDNCLPVAYAEQAERYRESLDEIIFENSEMQEAYLEAA